MPGPLQTHARPVHSSCGMGYHANPNRAAFHKYYYENGAFWHARIKRRGIVPLKRPFTPAFNGDLCYCVSHPPIGRHGTRDEEDREIDMRQLQRPNTIAKTLDPRLRMARMTEGEMQIPRCARNDNFLEDDTMRWCGCEDKRQNRWILLNA